MTTIKTVQSKVKVPLSLKNFKQTVKKSDRCETYVGRLDLATGLLLHCIASSIRKVDIQQRNAGCLPGCTGQTSVEYSWCYGYGPWFLSNRDIS